MFKKLILIVILLFSITSVAQGGDKIKDKIKAQKVAFITEKLSLTSEEAQKFWPIYNDFETKMEKIRSEDLRDIKTKMRKNPDMPDSEADMLLNKLLKAEKDMHEAKLQLAEDLKSVISSKKIILLKAAEDQFNRKLLERLKQMREKRARNRD